MDNMTDRAKLWLFLFWFIGGNIGIVTLILWVASQFPSSERGILFLFGAIINLVYSTAHILIWRKQ